jgi:putative peptidoglycan lipid II flippase
MADIAKGVRAFTIGTAISRVLGLVREQVFAHLYGSSLSTDAYQAAFRIPNLLRDLFAENALSSAFVPVLTSQKKKGKDAENLLTSNILNTLLLVVGIVTVAGIFFSPYLAKFIAFGFGNVPGKIALTGKLTAVMFPFLLFIALGAWAMSFLNTEGAFFIPSLAPAFFNIFSILTPIILFAYYTKKGRDPIFAMAVGVTVGGLMQLLIQVPRLFQKGFRYKLYLNFQDPEFRKVMALFIPVAIGLSGSRINVFVNTQLISLLEERSLTWLNYAYRIMHLPLGLFGIAVMTVSLPTFSRFVSEGKLEDLRATFFDSLKMVLFLTIPTSAVIAFLSSPITSLIYEHGKFSAADTVPVARILVLYMIGVPFISALRNVAAVFYAHKDPKLPMLASFAAVGINIILNLTLMHPLGYSAFPLSATISAVANILILYFMLPKKIGAFDSRPLAAYTLRLIAGALLGGLAGGIFHGLLSKSLAWQGASGLIRLLVKLVNVTLSGSAGLAVFYAVCLLLGAREVKGYVKRFTRLD